jgi:hypothetical protein
VSRFVRDQPQQLRKTSLQEYAQCAKHFNVLRLVLCTQPRSSIVAFGAVRGCAPRRTRLKSPVDFEIQLNYVFQNFNTDFGVAGGSRKGCGRQRSCYPDGTAGKRMELLKVVGLVEHLAQTTQG